MINLEDLIDLIKRSEVKKKIHVPSEDYYARRGDCDEETITYVDSQQLICELECLRDSH
jgi:Fe-S-cluster formation regulator IscX/YfhJ